MLKVQKDHKEPKVIREVHQVEPKVLKGQEEVKVLKEDKVLKDYKELKLRQDHKEPKEFNLQILQDLKVRKALFSVLDQQVLKEEQDLPTLDIKVLKDLAEVQDHKVPKGQQGHQDLQILD